MAIASNDNGLTPSVRERIEGTWERVRERVPTLTTALLVSAFCVGIGVGAMASKPFHNAEYRERIASKMKPVRDAIAAGNAEGDAADDIAIEELGIAYERLSKAERAVKDAGRLPPSAGACGIDVERMRE